MSLEGNNVVHHHFWRFRNTELNEIYAAMTLRSLGASLISVFIPIFLYINGYSLRQIIFLYLWVHLVELVLEYPSAQLIRKVGPKHIIIASLPFMVAYLWFLKSIIVYQWPLWLIGLVGGINLALFWQAYHYDFSKTKHRKKVTSDVSKLYIVLAILGAAAPLLGGTIATYFGIHWLYIFVIVLFLLAALPLMKKGELHRVDRPVDLSRVRLGDIKRDVISYMGNGVEGSAAGLFWPLFVYLIVSSYQAVGLITSLALGITVFVTFIIGKVADQQNRKQYINFGGFLNGLINFAQVFASTVLHVFMVNLGRSFAVSVYNAPYTSEYYLHADERSRSEYVFYMESAVDLGRIIFYVLLFVGTFMLGDKGVLALALILGGFGAMLIPLMPPARCEICGKIENKEIKVSRKVTT